MNSPMAAVLEGLKVFGKEALKGPAARYNEEVRRRHFDRIREVHWENTGRWLKHPDEVRAKRSKTKAKKERKQKVQLAMDEILNIA